MASQLAEIDSRELATDRSGPPRLKQGTYGLCEHCGGRIPVGRLNALPYSTLCIECQREMEDDPSWDTRRGVGGWERVFDAAPPLEEQREVRLSELDLERRPLTSRHLQRNLGPRSSDRGLFSFCTGRSRRRIRRHPADFAARSACGGSV